MNTENAAGEGLGRSASRGVATTALAQLAAISIQLVSVVVLARLLSPDDYGLFAMVLAIVMVGEVIREFGLANAAIQSPTLTSQQRSNLFWCNVGIGSLCGAALFLAAPLLADFYSDERVEPIAQALALAFVFSGIATQPRAHLSRDLRFAALAVTDVVPSVLGLGLAIYLAANGWGVWALVAQRLTIAASMLVLAAGFDRWLPGLPRRTPGMRPLLKYGLNLVATQLISGASRNADYVVLGYRFGSTSTGLYSRAFELVVNTLNQVNAPSTKVAVPVLSRLQDDRERYNRFLFAGQRTLLLVTVPLLGVGALLAQPLVEIALGERWAATVPFVQALAVVAASDKILGYATWWYALSRGRTDVTLKVTIVRAILVVAGIIFGSMFGPLGVAWGYAAAATAGWLADLAMYRWLAEAPSARLLLNSITALATNVIPCVGLVIAAPWLGQLPPVLHLAAGLSLYVLLWATAITAVPPFRSQLADVRLIARRFRG